MSSGTFLWHDYETFGRDATRERPVQFAAIRTDQNLQEVEDRTMVYCRQTADYLPDPESCVVHGVLPQTANTNGLSEWEFANKVYALMAQAGTCTVGYNNIRFDDEFSRQLFFRNLFDPYAREWQNGNSRWDLIDVVRLTRALRPEGIEWPVDADGKATNKLELLTAANGISHGDAHDALADVHATIEIARLIKRKQPRLFDFAYNSRTKQNVAQLLNMIHKPAALHVSGMYPASIGHLSVVMPLGPHPTNGNGILVYDLRVDPTDLINISKEEVAERIFTRAADLPDGVERIAVKTVHTNKCPVVAPLSTLNQENSERLQLNVNQALKYREQLIGNPQVIEKLAWAFASRDYPHATDPELTLYSGKFASPQDKHLMDGLHSRLVTGQLPPDDVAFEDTRLNEILFRLLARNRPEHMAEAEKKKWQKFCRSRVHEGNDGFRTIEEYENALVQLQESEKGKDYPDMIRQLRDYGQQVAAYSC